MMQNNPHLLKNKSLFAMFCLSYLPLFFLLTIKIITVQSKFLVYGGVNLRSVLLLFENFGFLIFLGILSLYGILGTLNTFRNIKRKKQNAFPIKISTIKPKNEDALTYIGTYIVPILLRDSVGMFAYSTFVVLFLVYYKLYSGSGMILINPLLNMRYGLYEIEYNFYDAVEKNKTALVISSQRWLNEDDELKVIKLGHRLYFAF